VTSVDLGRVYPEVESIPFLVTSYRGISLEFIHNACCWLVDDDDTELARFTLSSHSQQDIITAPIFRNGKRYR
jgi:tellurium resistance protein TerZ